MIIAIDGPAASGKSSTAKLLAKELNITYINTGAMYRACALYAINKGVKISKNRELKSLIKNIEIEFRGSQILLNGVNVTERIGMEDISKASSEIAVIGFVRNAMVELQREMGKQGSVVLEGRDIGSVVFPKADYKFFVVADVRIRAKRRLKELSAKGVKTTLEDVKNELIWRDKNDSTRKISPLVRTNDAIDVDTSKLSIMQQVEFIKKIVISR